MPDLNGTVLSCDQIMSLIDHRPPFLFLDRVVLNEPGVRCVAIKLLSKGHEFGAHAVLEALGQAGSLAVRQHPGVPADVLPVFSGFKELKFGAVSASASGAELVVLDVQVASIRPARHGVLRARAQLAQSTGVLGSVLVEGALILGFIRRRI